MIDLKAARELKESLMGGFDSGGMRAAERLLDSIEAEYGDLSESDHSVVLDGILIQSLPTMAQKGVVLKHVVERAPMCADEKEAHLGAEIARLQDALEQEQIRRHQAEGHTEHCAKRLVWGDGECTCTPVPSPVMTDKQLETLILRILAVADYDTYKGYLPHCSEEPEEIPRRMALLVRTAREAIAEGQPNRGPQSINEWASAVHELAKGKGWWDEDKARSVGDLFLLIISDVTEAFDEYRNGHNVTETYFLPDAPNKPEGVPTELADVVIRVLDYCGWAGIDLQAIMEQKHAYNLTRPYRHGNKRV